MLKNNFIFLCYLFLLVLLAPLQGPAKPFVSEDNFRWVEEEIVLDNDIYQILISGNSSKGHPEIQIIKKGAFEVKRILNPELTVFYFASDPGYLFKGKGIEGSSPVACWGKSEETELWKAGTPSVMMAKEVEQINQSVYFNFEKGEDFEIQLQLDLPDGEGIPEFSWKITSFREGWYSVGFTGIQEVLPEKLDFLYQPMVWSWKRFPVQAFLTPESYATTASVFTNHSDITEGLAVFAKEIPYRFADHANSRFGLVLRTGEGKARPMVFAPIPGGNESFMQPQQTHEFTIQYYLEKGDWLAGTDFLYKKVLQYQVERENAMISLNQTLENMIDFAMDDYYSGWVEEYIGYDYKFDVPNTVKNVSALHPLSLALTTANKQIYDRRGLPMLEFLLSREKYLYAINAKPEKQNQNPSHFLNGPAMELWEMASIHRLMGSQNPVFPAEMDRLFGQSRALNLETIVGGASWKDYLAKFFMQNDSTALDSAILLANEYLDLTFYNYPEDFSTNAGLKDAQATFVNDYSTNWQELLELYEVTGQKKYLDAAYEGAKQLVLWTRSHPFAPDENILVNQGGEVDGVFPGRRFESDSYAWQEFDMTTKIQEQVVPAWHTSLVGLLPEQPGTYVYGPIMLFHQAGALLRLSHLKKDEVLKKIAYNGILGRYNNFPGYYFNSFETNVYQQTDYPLHPYLEINYNAVFYNHIWPHIALLQDFLVSDAFYRSRGKIDFPALYSPGYAFLSNKVYGHLPGKIYHHEDVRLWLPKQPFLTQEKALNHILGRDDQHTYLVLMNTAGRELKTELYFNPSVLNWNHGQVYPIEVMDEMGKIEKGQFENGILNIKLPAHGIVTYKIEGLSQKNHFESFAFESKKTVDDDIPGYIRKEYPQQALGTLNGMSLQLHKDFKDFYIYATASEKETKRVTLRYREDGEDWKELYDEQYPFEFSFRLADPAATIEWKWEAIDLSGRKLESDVFKLQ